MAELQNEKSLSEVHATVETSNRGRFRTLLAFAGPAYLVSVGYMDPGNWATDIAGGSRFGYQLIFVLLLSNWVALLLQSLAAKLGIVKGWDLAQASRQHYPAWVNLSLYVLAEIAIAATDLAEIIGMAIGLNLLFHLPLLYGVLITVFDTFLLLFLINKGIRAIELFVVGLVSIIGMAFFAEMFIVEPDLAGIASGFIPTQLNGEALYIAIGIIGATIMPHNLYLHSSLVQTRKIRRDEEGIRKAIKFNFIDSAIALNAAFFVNAAILILAAAAFYKHGYNNVADISDAHELLAGIFGSWAPALFAIALIAAGQSSTITGTLAGQIVMEGYLNLRISPWMRRLITRLVAVVPAVVTIVFFGEEQLGELLILSQVILSVQLGFAILPLIHFTGSKRMMGTFANTMRIKVLAWISALLILGLNIRMIANEVTVYLSTDPSFGMRLLVLLVLAFIGILLCYVAVSPLVAKARDRRLVPHPGLRSLSLSKAREYASIAVTVDFSSMDIPSIQHAIGLGNKRTQYLLIHVVESAAAQRHGDEVMDTETMQDIAWLQTYARELTDAGYQVRYEMGYGNRANNICRIVESSGSGLLVMGAHGHSGLKDLIFGSTVDAVRHKLKIPILVVRS